MQLVFASAPLLLFSAQVLLLGRTIGVAAAAAAAAASVAPINVSPSQSWDGTDGYWSSFAIRVGSPAQTLRVLVSTSATSTWVIADEYGCNGLTLDKCVEKRGQLYKSNSSSTWKDIGPYDVHIEENLGYKVPAQWGFDTVGLDFPGAGGPTLPNTTVTQIADTNFLLGTFGLNPRPNNFTLQNEQNESPSYLSILHKQSLIPSLSFSYTAGAKYRHNGVLGSLLLGGLDEGQFVPNGLSFPFFHDQERDLTVGLQAITSEDGNTKTDLLPEGILALIDSTVSQLWLPVAACQLFEEAFGITYDKTSGYYLLTGRQHNILLDQKPSITFTLGQLARGGKTVNIEIPYNAFDLNISYPLVGNNTYYFPLRRAANESQYTLGRTFLQEAYLTVDYGRQNFSVSQRNWDLASKSKIVTIGEPDTSSTDTPGVGGSSNGNSTSTVNRNKEEKSGISTGAIAGIAIAGVALLIGIGLLVFFCIRRKQKRKAHELEGSGVPFPADSAGVEPGPGPEPKPEEMHSNMTSPITSPMSPGTPGNRSELGIGAWKPPERQELHGQHSFYDETGMKPRELSAHPSYSELDAQQGGQAYELEAPHGAQEVSAVEDDGGRMRPHHLDPRWGSTDSPVMRRASPVARRPVGGQPF